MASRKAEKPVGTQLPARQFKKEPAKASPTTPKALASKLTAKPAEPINGPASKPAGKPAEPITAPASMPAMPITVPASKPVGKPAEPITALASKPNGKPVVPITAPASKPITAPVSKPAPKRAELKPQPEKKAAGGTGAAGGGVHLH